VLRAQRDLVKVTRVLQSSAELQGCVISDRRGAFAAPASALARIDPGLLAKSGPHCEPVTIGTRQRRIESHQPLGCRPRGNGSTVATVRLADCVMQRPVVEVVQPSAVVDAIDGNGIASLLDL